MDRLHLHVGSFFVSQNFVHQLRRPRTSTSWGALILGLKGLTLYFRRCISIACGWIWFSRHVRRASKLYFFIWRAPRMWWKQNHLRFYRNLFSKNLVDKKLDLSQTSKIVTNIDVDANIQTLEIFSKLIKRWWYFGKIIHRLSIRWPEVRWATVGSRTKWDGILERWQIENSKTRFLA